MKAAELVRRRLAAQHLLAPADAAPVELVRELGAVQAQDWPGAKWAVAQRLSAASNMLLDAALDRGDFIRTHILRPTWHLVAPEDLRWMLELTGPRVHQALGYPYRYFEIDTGVRRRSERALERALRDGRSMLREELAQVLSRARIGPVPPRRAAFIVMAAELDGVICSGPRRGARFTYALLDERVPPAPPMPDREAALRELALRYFPTRGPATVHDFAWWSGLTVADARRATAAAASELVRVRIGERDHWHGPSAAPRARTSPVVHFLPSYDEYFIGLRDRSAMLAGPSARARSTANERIFINPLTVDGVAAGGWRRTLSTRSAAITLHPIRRLGPAERRAAAAVAERYRGFIELPVRLDFAG